MKICLSCGFRFDTAEWRCPTCLLSPPNVMGFPAFAPELMAGEGNFRPELFDQLAELESTNFWFRARNRLILWAFTRYFPQARNFLEIGCGTGYVLRGIAKAFPDLQICGSEIFISGLAHAAKRVPQAALFQMDARSIPFENEFDVIGAFDVLEHIVEDELVLKEMYQALRPGGGIILTVPQHPFLWSYSDELACHVRRYTVKDALKKVKMAGFNVVLSTSFVSVLLPLMVASRLRKRKVSSSQDPLSELRMSGVLNAALEKALDFERWFISSGLSFPFGGSRLVIGFKESNS